MAPWASDSQRRWGNSKAGRKELGKKGVEEYNEKSKGKEMPEKVKAKKKKAGKK
jgi:hypothetical protein